jgi:hypothetical protein
MVEIDDISRDVRPLDWSHFSAHQIVQIDTRGSGFVLITNLNKLVTKIMLLSSADGEDPPDPVSPRE